MAHADAGRLAQSAIGGNTQSPSWCLFRPEALLQSILSSPLGGFPRMMGFVQSHRVERKAQISQANWGFGARIADVGILFAARDGREYSTMRPIFISYRRDDSEGQAGRLFQDLRDVFGAESVFMDVAAIEPGVDFRRVIEKNTATCGVLLAIIGRNWLSVPDADGRRRLEDPNDFVRLETASALRRDIPVVPVLVQGARMPRADELPDDLKDLSFRNSVELTHARWDSDVKLLIEALRKLLTHDPTPETEAGADNPPALLRERQASNGRLRWATPVASVAVLLAVVGGWAMLRPATPPETEPPQSGVAVPTATKAASKSAPSPAANDVKRQESASAEAARKEAAEREVQAKRQAQLRAHHDGICISGFVWREARPGDKVCVTPSVRSRTLAENQAAALTRSPTGGAYGPSTCKQGYVWREAFPSDVVCVIPPSRQQAATDNAQAASRVVPLPP